MDPFDDDDPWLDDPGEFDPDSLGPQVDIPQAPDPSTADLSSEVIRTFWLVVIMANVGLLATSLGVMLVALRGQVRRGGLVFLLGVLALLIGYRRYRQYTND